MHVAEGNLALHCSACCSRFEHRRHVNVKRRWNGFTNVSVSMLCLSPGMVRGATKSLVIDLGFVLEGQRPEELPEALLGAFRLNHLDCTQAKRIDTTHELPLLPRPLQQNQLVQMAAAAAAAHAGGVTAVANNASPEAAGVTLSVCGQGDQQRRVCSASGAVPSASVAAAAADRAALQQQVGERQQGHVRTSSKARNSASVLETGRTMTGHARSR